MNLFTQLRHHAQVRPEAVAIYSRERVTTYRKLWSRIERATARLQREWNIGPEERVAYLGQGHPDAIVLYVALARSGALLMPVRPSMPKEAVESALRKADVRLVLHDDGLAMEGGNPAVQAKPLSELISTPCPCEPARIVEQNGRPALIAISVAADGSVSIAPRAVDHSPASPFAAEPVPPHIRANLFDEEIFASVALRTLIAGNMLACD